VNGFINIQGTATDNIGVSQVEFFLDGNSIGLGTANGNVYSISSFNTQNLVNGSHRIYTVARDAADNTRTSIEVNFNINNNDSTLPVSAITAPLNNKNVIFCAVPEEIIDGEYPEDWYLGLKSFKDEMWKTNVETGETVYLSNLSNGAGEDIDAYKISLSQNEKFITFLNKNNLKLYTLQIEE
jgi:hypothetical protein